MKSRLAQLERAIEAKQDGVICVVQETDGMIWHNGEKMAREEFERRYGAGGQVVLVVHDPGPFGRQEGRWGIILDR